MKKTKYKRNYKKINKNKFEQDLEHIEKHAFFKQINKKEIKTRRKLWIITGILTSIQNKNKIYH